MQSQKPTLVFGSGILFFILLAQTVLYSKDCHDHNFRDLAIVDVACSGSIAIDHDIALSDCYDPDVEDEVVNMLMMPCIDIVAEVAVVDAECREANGNMYVTVQGDGAYNYIWSTGSTSQGIDNLSTGVYCVTITSVNEMQCPTKLCQEIDEIYGPVVESTVANATCTADGMITITMINEGSVGDRTIMWDGPEANDGGPVVVDDGFMISGPSGAYDIVVADNSGCRNYIREEIGLDPVIDIETEITQQPDCDGANGSFTAEVSGGSPDYSFYVDDELIATQSNSSFVLENQEQGYYTIKVTDGNNCIREVIIQLTSTQGPALELDDWQVTNGVCSGDLGLLEYNGGGSPDVDCKIFYEDTKIAIAEFNADEVLSVAVSNGSYTVLCEDQDGCIDILSGLEVNAPEPLDFVARYNEPTCAGGMTDGIVEVVEVTGGYSLDELDIQIQGNGLTFTSYSTGRVLMEGTYTISVCYTGSDQNASCCKTRQIKLEDRQCITCPAFRAEVAVREPNCNEEDGAAELIVQGDPSLYTFDWSNGATGHYQSGLGSGQYYVTIAPAFASDCPQVKEFTISEIGAPVIHPEIIHTTCTTLGQITLPIDGNSNTYTVIWTGPESTMMATTGNGDFVISDLIDGTYKIEVIDAQGCMEFVEVEIMQMESLELIPDDMSMPLCGEASGTVSLEVRGGTADYTFSYNGNPLPPQSGNMVTWTDLPVGIHYFRVEDANGCYGDTLVTINNFEEITYPQPDISYEHAECATNTGHIAFIGRGDGANFYELFYFGSDVPIGSAYGHQSRAWEVIPGMYYLVCTDPDGCQLVSAHMDVKFPENLDFWVQYECATCEGGLLDGYIEIVDITGYPIEDIEIVIGGDIPDTHIEPETRLDGLPPGNYTVTVTYFSMSNFPCPKTVEVEICEPLCSDVCTEIKAEVAVVDSECGKNNGNAVVQVLDSPHDHSYKWSHGPTVADVEGLAPGSYTITITPLIDSSCDLIKEVIIGEINGPIAVAEVTDAECNGEGSITIQWYNGSTPYSIEWDGPDSSKGSSYPQESPFEILGVAGKYFITVTDANGCQDFLTTEILEEPSLELQIKDVHNSDCDFENGRVSVEVSGGLSPYSWALNNTGMVTSSLATFDELSVGVHNIIVTDSDGCTGETSFTIFSNTPPIIYPDMWTIENANCSGDYGVLEYDGSGTSKQVYSIFAQGSTLPIVSISGDRSLEQQLPQGSYFITLEDEVGCKAILEDLVVSGPEVLDYVVQYQDPTCDGYSDGSITIVELTGGYKVSDLNFEILDQAGDVVGTTNFVTGLQPGNYFITICYNGHRNEQCCKSRTVELDGGECCEEMGGTVFYDYDNDGCQELEDGETGIADVDVYVYPCSEMDPTSDNAIASTSTDEKGNYIFSNTEEGGNICLDPAEEYFVVIDIENEPGESMEGYEFSTPENSECHSPVDEDNVDPDSGRSDCYDPDDNDDDDEHIDAGVVPLVDVALVKTATQTGPFKYGDVVTFNVEVFNQGMMDLYEIKVNDFIPCGYKYLSDNNTVWGYDPFNSIATTTIPFIAIGKSEILHIELEIFPCDNEDAWLNIAEVEKFENEDGRDITKNDIDSDGDNDPNNDTTTDNEYNEDGKNGGDEDDHDPEEIEVFDLALIKTTVSSGPYLEGDPVTYNIKVVNQGNVTAANVVVTDHLPPGLSFDTKLNPGWYAIGEDSHSYSVPGTISPGQEINIQFVAVFHLLDATAQNYTNIAEISDNTNEDGGPVKDADSDPDTDPDNDGDPIDNQLNDKGDEDDHDPEVLDLTEDLPLDCAFDCTIACHHELNLSLSDDDCSTVILPTHLLSGLDPACNDNRYYQVMLTDAYGNVIEPPIVTQEHVGQQITYKVSNLCENSCWGYLNVEFKMGPVIDCEDLTTSCLMYEFECEELLPDISPGCDVEIVEYGFAGEAFEFLDCEDYTMVITRSYRAVDALGNVSECERKINLEPLDPGQVAYPQDIIIDCGDARFEYDEEDIPLPWLPDYDNGLGSGVPLYVFTSKPDSLCADRGYFPNADGTLYLTEMPDQSGIPCNAIMTYSDVEVVATGCGRKIMRTWEIVMWDCGETVSDNMVQVIELKDNSGPIIACPSDTTVIATIGCKATLNIGEANAEDDCSAILDYTTKFPGGFYNENGGTVELPQGDNVITYTVYDGCGNSSSCDLTVTVESNSNPVAVCDQDLVVTINSSGDAEIPAIAFDEGSYAACDKIEFEVMRMELNDLFHSLGADTIVDHKKYVLKNKLILECQGDLNVTIIDNKEYLCEDDLWTQRVRFCCTDALQDVMVLFRVQDPAGASNNCMSSVFVKDVGNPNFDCPDDVTLNCDVDLDINDLSAYGVPSIVSNCAIEYPVTEEVSDLTSNCSIGNIRRTLTVSNNIGGTIGTCVQTITLENIHAFDPQSIVWPVDMEVGCIAAIEDLLPDPDVDGSYPTWPLDVACTNIGAEYEDDYYFIDINQPECGKLVRTWTLIDWCDPVGDDFRTYKHDQTIKVLNDVAPTFDPLDDITIDSNDPDCLVGEINLLVGGATDDCTEVDDLRWSYTMLLDNGTEVEGAGQEIIGTYPLGDHNILWTVSDGCNNVISRSQEVSIVNNKPPIALCKSGVSINIEAEWMHAPLPSTNLDAGSSQECGNELGLYFNPIDLTTEKVFHCEDLGINEVIVYVVDLDAGTFSECEVEVTVTDNSSVCLAPRMATISGSTYTSRSMAVVDAEVKLEHGAQLQEMTDNEGEYAFEPMSMGGSYMVEPYKNDDPLNGVSTLDVILIQRHILGVELLDDPYDLIAADVNSSENINGIDLVELRKLILGIYQEFPDNTSWKFIDAEYQFPDIVDPWLVSIDEDYQIRNLNSNMQIDFIGVKIGDVNGSVEASLRETEISRRSQRWPLIFKLVDNSDNATTELRVDNYENINGWQTTIELPEGAGEDIVIDAGQFSDDINYYHDKVKNTISISCAHDQFQDLENGTAILTLEFPQELPSNISFGSKVTRSEAYRNFAIVPIELEKAVTTSTDLSIAPNPWSDHTVLDFEMSRDSDYKIEFFDVDGKLIYARIDFGVQGKNRVEISGSEIEYQGVIYLQLTTPDGLFTQKAMRIGS